MSVERERRAEILTETGPLERMLEIRAVEERIQDLYTQGFVRGSTHLAIGQEAVAVGIAAALRPTDVVTCTYRGHALALALGMTPEAVMGEICGRQIGCAGGLGGSMHLTDRTIGLMPTSAIVGGGVPVAGGAALAAQYRGTDDVAVAVFGDGAANIGAVHETMNLAAVWTLPLIFVIENNLYGEYTRIELSTPITDLATRAAAYALPFEIVDGQDVRATTKTMSLAVERARAGNGSTVIEMKTYRYSGHSRSDAASYRPPGELDAWLKRDPILIESAHYEESLLEGLRKSVESRVSRAVERVMASEAPPLAQMLQHITKSPNPRSDH